MKEIEINFNLLKENSNLGDYILFVNAIKGKNYPEGTILKSFKKLVSKDDYSRADLPLLSKHLVKISRLSQ